LAGDRHQNMEIGSQRSGQKTAFVDARSAQGPQETGSNLHTRMFGQPRSALLLGWHRQCQVGWHRTSRLAQEVGVEDKGIEVVFYGTDEGEQTVREIPMT